MELLLPIGRLVAGSLYKEQLKVDNFGQPKISKKTGKQEIQYNFAVAIPKNGTIHWKETEWGKKIYQIGASAYPGQENNPHFAWKIIDGDSTIPNKKNKRPCDQAGYSGNYILWFSQGWKLKIVNADGTKEIKETDAVKTGYYIQVFANIKGNNPSPTPGVYLNPVAVAFSGYGDVIETNIGVNTTSIGFGSGEKPADLKTEPTQTATVDVLKQMVEEEEVDVFGYDNKEFLNPPKKHIMTPKAGDKSYEDFINAGWNDKALIENGYMI